MLGGCRYVLTCASRRGDERVGTPWEELARVIGGVTMRRPNLSNLAGDVARETMAEAEATRSWCRRGWSGILVGSEVGGNDLLAFTRAIAASASCCNEIKN